MPEQLVCVGPHRPVQLAVEPEATQVLFTAQVDSTLELRPLAAHFLTSCPWQVVAFGVHTCGVQVPAWQVSLALQAVPPTRYPEPEALQVAAVLPSHDG